MSELTIISTCYKEADRPVVKIGMSEANQIVTGHKLVSDVEIDNQIDDLIRQLESARIETKNFLNESGTP